MKTVLITGFEPFGGDARNPSAEIARALNGRRIDSRVAVGAVLPCAFGTSREELRRLLRLHKPDLVVCVGLAGNRTEITPERVAINVDDARIPDNRRRQPIDKPIVPGGPVAYWSTLPVKAIVAALRRRALPASVSQTAGTFVCNHVFYALMHELRRQPRTRGGFIHVPWPEGWKGALPEALPIERLVEAVGIAISVALRQRRDAHRRGGAVA